MRRCCCDAGCTLTNVDHLDKSPTGLPDRSRHPRRANDERDLDAALEIGHLAPRGMLSILVTMVPEDDHRGVCQSNHLRATDELDAFWRDGDLTLPKSLRIQLRQHLPYVPVRVCRRARDRFRLRVQTNRKTNADSSGLIGGCAHEMAAS